MYKLEDCLLSAVQIVRQCLHVRHATLFPANLFCWFWYIYNCIYVPQFFRSGTFTTVYTCLNSSEQEYLQLYIRASILQIRNISHKGYAYSWLSRGQISKSNFSVSEVTTKWKTGVRFWSEVHPALSPAGSLGFWSVRASYLSNPIPLLFIAPFTLTNTVVM
jgi:hypothetical protein